MENSWKQKFSEIESKVAKLEQDSAIKISKMESLKGEWKKIKAEMQVERKRHTELCYEVSNYMDEKTCLICDADFNTNSEVIKHIKQKHLDIIVVMEIPSEKVSSIQPLDVKKEIKKEVMVSNTQLMEVKKEIIFTNNKPMNVKKEVKEEIIHSDIYHF